MNGRLIVWLGLAMVLFSLVGMVMKTREFDRYQIDRVIPVSAVNAKPVDADHVRIPLGRYYLPSPGVVRAVVCPTPLADPHAVLRARASQTAPVLSGEENLTEDASRAKQCFDASYRGRHAGDLEPEIVLPRAALASVHRVEVSASRRITPFDAWPVLLMIAGFVVVISAPRTNAPHPDPHRDPPTLPLPPGFVPPPPDTMPLGGIVPPELVVPGQGPPEAYANLEGLPPALPAVEPAAGPTSFLDFLLGRPAPVRWRFSWILAVVILVGDHIVPGIAIAIWAIVNHVDISGGGGTGSFFAAGLLLQHGLLVTSAFWFLGGVGAADRRAAIGLVPTTPAKIGRAIGLALLLVAIAGVTTTFLIKQTHQTPIGQLVEKMPIRYVIGFGALAAPVSEELFFRGVFYGAFAKRSKWVGIVASTVVFTAMHATQLEGARIGLVPIACVGFTNAWLRAESGGLTEPWIVHTVYNGVLSLGLYLG